MEDIYVIGHKNPDTDSVASAIVYAGIRGYKAAVAGDMNPETEFVLNKFGVVAPEVMTNAEGKKLVLVDHNELAQMIEGGDKADIQEIIDHHKVAVMLAKPIAIRVEPVGSTATLIAKMYPNEVKSDPVRAGLLLSAILSDTVIFKSPTTTEEDRSTAAALAPICGIDDIVAYGIEMKKTNASITGKSIADVIGADFKAFDLAGKKIGVAQTEMVDISEAVERKGEIVARLNEIMTEGYDLVIYAATDIMNEGSELFFAGDKVVMEKAFGAKIEADNSVYVKGLMSRKKQIIPPLEEVYKQ